MVKSYLGIIQFMECSDCGRKLCRTTGEGFIFEKKAQYYLYEFTDDGDDLHAKRPRQCCPYATIQFSLTSNQSKQSSSRNILTQDSSLRNLPSYESRKASDKLVPSGSEKSNNDVTPLMGIKSLVDGRIYATFSKRGRSLWSGVIKNKEKILSSADLICYSSDILPITMHDLDEDISSDSEEEFDSKSSCSSMAGNEFSVNCGKGSSTITVNNMPPGKISGNDNFDNPSISTADSNKATSVGLGQNQNELKHRDTRNNRQLGVPEETSHVPEAFSSISATSVMEVKCVNSWNEKEELESEKPERMQDKKMVSLPLNLEDYNSTAELELLGLEVLKKTLTSLGLKCGGTLQQRAQRLFSIRGLPLDKIDPSLFAKQSEKKVKKK